VQPEKVSFGTKLAGPEIGANHIVSSFMGRSLTRTHIDKIGFVYLPISNDDNSQYGVTGADAPTVG
jgi:hypothetical protein